MSDYNSECIALQKIAMVRSSAPFSEGGCKPPGARKETSWSYGSLGHVSWFAGSVPPLQFPCWVGFISLWPQEGKSLHPRRQVFMFQIQFCRPCSLSTEEQRRWCSFSKSIWCGERNTVQDEDNPFSTNGNSSSYSHAWQPCSHFSITTSHCKGFTKRLIPVFRGMLIDKIPINSSSLQWSTGRAPNYRKVYFLP